MMKKSTLLACMVLSITVSFGQAPRKRAHFLNANRVEAPASTMNRNAHPNSTMTNGDTLLWMPLNATDYISPVDTASFGIHVYDVDGFARNVNSIQTASFGTYTDTIGGPLFDVSQGDVYPSLTFLATSWFSSPHTANNWLTMGPITIPANGATLSWKHCMLDNTYRDGYSVVLDTAGFTPTDFATGNVIYTATDNDPSTAGDTVLTLVASHNLSGAAYGGKQVYIGFHHTANDMYILGIDAILFRAGPVGVNEISLDNSIEVFPNPSKGLVNIKNSGMKENFSIRAYNAMGQLVYSDKFNQFSSTTVDLSRQPAGVYSIKLESTKSTITKSVVITHN